MTDGEYTGAAARCVCGRVSVGGTGGVLRLAGAPRKGERTVSNEGRDWLPVAGVCVGAALGLLTNFWLVGAALMAFGWPGAGAALIGEALVVSWLIGLREQDVQAATDRAVRAALAQAAAEHVAALRLAAQRAELDKQNAVGEALRKTLAVLQAALREQSPRRAGAGPSRVPPSVYRAQDHDLQMVEMIPRRVGGVWSNN